MLRANRGRTMSAENFRFCYGELFDAHYNFAQNVPNQRLISNVSRCQFSLTRMIKVTEDGQVTHRAGKCGCLRFPSPGDKRLRKGLARNFQVFDALQFLASRSYHYKSGQWLHQKQINQSDWLK
jgi:hypothetical protein